MCTFFQTLSVCIHVINNVNFMDMGTDGDAMYITKDR